VTATFRTEEEIHFNGSLNLRSHFSPSLCSFVKVLKFTLQKHSSHPIYQTQHISSQLAIIRFTACRGNCWPFIMLLHFHFEIIFKRILPFLFCCTHMLWVWCICCCCICSCFVLCVQIFIGSHMTVILQNVVLSHKVRRHHASCEG
jgi:hypothetical protein